MRKRIKAMCDCSAVKTFPFSEGCGGDVFSGLRAAFPVEVSAVSQLLQGKSFKHCRSVN